MREGRSSSSESRHVVSRGKRLALAALTFGVIGAVAAPEVAQAHFILQSPKAWMSQTTLGLPEKLGPCGDEDDGTDAATPTGIVTAVQQGQKITVTIDEVIFHPGHYRISLAEDRSLLPVEPLVDAGTTPCGTAVINPTPTFPVLADGVFVHTTPFTTPQSIELTIPSTITCAKCTLQVIEFMSDHALNNPGGCFYHHCADLSIAPPDASSEGGTEPMPDSGKPAPGADAAPKAGPDASSQDGGGGLVAYGGGGTATPSSAGCGCLVGRAGSGAGGLLALGALVLFRLLRKGRKPALRKA
jgi:hypothetical protein